MRGWRGVGGFNILLWKAGFDPQVDTFKAPGDYTGSISKDNQVASSGRHRELKVTGAGK